MNNGEDGKEYSAYEDETEVILPEGSNLIIKIIGDSNHKGFKF